MSTTYQPIIDEVTQVEDYPERPELFFIQISSREERSYPRAIGIAQIMLGFLLAILGGVEVFILPITEDHLSTALFGKNTCGGAGLYAGLLMVLTGSTAVRASLSKRKSTIVRFYNLSLVTLLIYLGLTIFLIWAYCKGWTVRSAYPPNSRLYHVHMFVTIFTILGLIFAVMAVVLYYKLLCLGEGMLLQWWLDLCSCCRSKVSSAQLHTDRDRTHLIIQ